VVATASSGVRVRTYFLVVVALWALAFGALAVVNNCGDSSCSEASVVRDVAWVVFLGLVATSAVVGLLGFASLAGSAVVRIRGGAPGAPPLRLVLGIAAALIGALSIAMAAYLWASVPLTAKTLTNSVERESGSAGIGGECSRNGSARWRCEVTDGEGSGTATYEVSTDGSCWRARRTSPVQFTEVPMPARSDGCTRLRDQYPLLRD
jgi:hypothetical protein